LEVFFGFAHTLDVHLLCLSELTTVLALSDRTALLLDLKKRAICVFAGRGTMALNAGLTSVFFVTNQNHCVRKNLRSWTEIDRLGQKSVSTCPLTP